MSETVSLYIAHWEQIKGENINYRHISHQYHTLSRNVSVYSSCYVLLQVLFHDSKAAAHDNNDGCSVSHSVRYIIRPTIFLNNLVWSRYVYVALISMLE